MLLRGVVVTLLSGVMMEDKTLDDICLCCLGV